MPEAPEGLNFFKAPDSFTTLTCWNCCALGGGMYKPYEGETVWWLGLDAVGQAHYSCDDCKPLLFNPVLAIWSAHGKAE